MIISIKRILMIREFGADNSIGHLFAVACDRLLVEPCSQSRIRHRSAANEHGNYKTRLPWQLIWQHRRRIAFATGFTGSVCSSLASIYAFFSLRLVLFIANNAGDWIGLSGQLSNTLGIYDYASFVVSVSTHPNGTR